MGTSTLGIALNQVVRGGRGSPVSFLQRKEVDTYSSGAAISPFRARKALAAVQLVLRRDEHPELVLATSAVEVRSSWSHGSDGTFDTLGEFVCVALATGFIGRHGLVESRGA